MRYFTAGESHGPELTAIIEGLPAGLELSHEDINKELKKRQAGYGRGGRMKIESDQVRFTSGLRHGKTLASPLTMIVENKDFKNWTQIMEAGPVEDRVKSQRRLTKPRPGHADLVGGIKYDFDDLRNVLERSSARETTMRVAIGAVAKKILAYLDIHLASHIVNFGGIEVDLPENLTVADIESLTEKSEVKIVNADFEEQIKAYIDDIKHQGDTIGGIIEVRAENVPPGLGSYVHWDRKLDGKIAQAVLSINAFKGVEFGLGFDAGKKLGSQVMDQIDWTAELGYGRISDNLGGFEGGMTNGSDIIVRGVMKPIPTLYKPLMSVDIETHESYKAQVERSDPTAVPAASVVMENVIATVLAGEILDQFPSDNMTSLKKSFEDYKKSVKNF